MDWSWDRELIVRMVFTLGLLAVVTCVLIVELYNSLVAGSQQVSFGVIPPAVSEGFGIVGTIVTTVAIIGWSSGQTPALCGFRTQSMERTETRNSDHLHDTVERLAQRADLPVPTVIVADSTLPNAYTSGLSPQRATIVVTTGLLETLESEEVRAVLAHELAHVKNRDAAVMTVASVPLVIARLLHELADEQWTRRSGQGNGTGFDTLLVGLHAVCVVAAGAWWLCGRLPIRVLRYRELAADRGSIAITGSPAALANALETIATRIESLSREELRSAPGAIEAFAVVPVETETADEPIRLGQNGERRLFLDEYIHPLRKKIAVLLATHPSVERRRQQLRDIEAEV